MKNPKLWNTELAKHFSAKDISAEEFVKSQAWFDPISSPKETLPEEISNSDDEVVCLTPKRDSIKTMFLPTDIAGPSRKPFINSPSTSACRMKLKRSAKSRIQSSSSSCSTDTVDT